MLGLPDRFVLFDTEYTSWEGAKERNWSGPGEHREIIQIGALIVGPELKQEDEYMVYVLPQKNPKLSDFIVQLTGITQETIDANGKDFPVALQEFDSWTRGLPLWSHGNDLTVVKENCELVGIPDPFTERVWGDTRELFRARGIEVEKYSSGTILGAFGKTPPLRAHDAVNDMKNLLLALRELAAKE
jgi:inhibitor of KinA sporulation pathway (predicted exonuclease)